jgi:dTDP-4-dehydrorhamnose reductase
MNRRIYIAGCGGMLGEAFHAVFGQSNELMCTDIDVNDPWLSYTDIRDLDAYRASVRSFRPDFLFHLGALTSLEYCERHVDDAYATNQRGVEHATLIANELDIPLLYIGTAGIFDGKRDTYDESDIPNPLGHYAKSKYAGERHVVEHARRHLVCRAGWMMGGGPRKDKKFVHKVLAQLRDGRRELSIVNDKNGTPTYTVDFARNVELLLKSERWGLYNMACEGSTSRLGVARELLAVTGLADRVRIVEVDSDYFKQEYFAMRPASERLVNRRLEECGMNVMRDWRVALREYIGTAYRGYLNGGP